MLLWVLCDVALANPEKSFLATLQTLKSFTGMQPTQIEAESYFAANVETVVQNQCVVCHRSGGTAPSNGARVVYPPALHGICDISLAASGCNSA